jgi:choline dehydrogenase
MQADFVIVGAGSAGCVLAERLTASGFSAVLIEAGPPDRSPLIHVPAGVAKLMGHPVYDWNFAAEPQPTLCGRVIRLPRGRTLGGTSSTNWHELLAWYPRRFRCMGAGRLRGMGLGRRPAIF